MRESIGGAWIYALVLGFVLLFTSFISLAISYNKVFKVKNEVLSIIEKYNGVNEKNKDIISNYLNTSGYSAEGINADKCKDIDEDEATEINRTGYKSYGEVVGDVKLSDDKTMCIKRIQREKNVYIYDVVLFYDFNIPLISEVFNFKFKISGQSQDIYYPNDLPNLTK